VAVIDIEPIRERFSAVAPFLDERGRRLVAAAEAFAAGMEGLRGCGQSEYVVQFAIRQQSSHGAGRVNWLFGHADSLLGSDPGSSRLLSCSTRAAEHHIRSPLRAADTKIPRTRGHRAREDGANLYGGIHDR
jgi:hypothetical protein